MDITKQYWGRTRDITIVNKTLYTMDSTKHNTRDITWHIVPGHYKHENEVQSDLIVEQRDSTLAVEANI